VLVIVLGLMVSLARHVREQSAQALTKNLLRQLDGAMTEYVRRYDRRWNTPLSADQDLPRVAPFPPPAVIAAAAAADSTAGHTGIDGSRKADRGQLNEAAMGNNRDLVKALAGESSLAEKMLPDLPASVYDGQTLRDAWGSPIVFMPDKHPWVGTAPRDKRYFFFSAGPDRDYLTPIDNLYSYEEIAGTPKP
jgi:hypothetical protein